MTARLAVLNDALALLLELVALVALGVGGWAAGGLLAAVALPAVAIVLWGLFAAPRARLSVPGAALAVKTAVFGGAAVSLVGTGHPVAGVGFAAVALANTVAVLRWRAGGHGIGR